MTKNLLFIPIYNCSKQIKRVLESIYKNNKYFFDEILVIDNLSSDDSIEVSLNCSKLFNDKVKFTVIQNIKNLSLGGSHKVALQYANINKYNFIIIMHGDDQAEIADLNIIMNSKIYHDYDCVLGSRFMKNSKLINYSKIRILGNFVFNFIFSVLLKRKISDLGSGLNILSVKKFYNSKVFTMPNDLTFNYHLILFLSYYKFKYLFIPISWREKDQLSNMKAFSQIFKMLKIILAFFFLRKKFFKETKIKKIPFNLLFSK